MYPQEDVPPRRTVRLPVDLEDRFGNQIRPPWLLEEPWGEPVADEGAPGAVDSGLYGLARGRGDGVAFVKGYRFPGASSAMDATGEEVSFSSKSGISELPKTGGP